MLQKALKQTSDYITESLTKDICKLGQCTSDLEIRVDDIKTNVLSHDNELETLREENLILQTRLEDFENRARRSKLHIRGIPETIVDLHCTMTALFQELLPSILVNRLEMDRIHRALTPRKPEGPPHDIIITNFHFYRTKEQLMAAARGNNSLIFQDHPYQLFADLSPITVAKQHALKPLLHNLQQHQIPYQWGFTFSIRFTYQGVKHSCRSSDELQNTL